MPQPIPDEFAERLARRPPVDMEADAYAAVLARKRGITQWPTGEEWLQTLPDLIDRHLDQWDLVIEGEPLWGTNSLVLPVRPRSDASEPLVLKVVWPHPEAQFEHLALRAWEGQGVARLVAADPARYCLALQRLSLQDLEAEPILEACETLGLLMAGLQRPALAQVPTLSDLSHLWRRRLDIGHESVPRRLTAQALAHIDELVSDSRVNSSLVHADLHFGNVLRTPSDGSASDDALPWCVIGPQPISGEWAYAVAPAIWNRAGEAAKAYNLRNHLRLRADVISEAAGVDPGRVRAWTFVRLVLVGLGVGAAGGATGDARRAQVGRLIAAAKAFAD